MDQGDLTPLLDTGPHAAPAVRDGDELGAQPHPIAQRFGKRGGEPIVASADAVHGAARRRIVRRELIDEREERQLLGISQEEAAEAEGRGPQLVIGPGLVEPLRDRLSARARW